MGVLEKLIIACFYTFILELYVETFLERKNNIIMVVISYLPFAIWQFVNTSADTFAYTWNLLINIVCIMWVLICGYQGKILLKMTFAASYYTIGMLAEVLIWFVIWLINDTKGINNVFFAALATNTILLLIVILLRLRFGNRIKGAKFSVNLLFIPIGSIVVVYTIFKACGESDNNLTYAVASGMIMLCINLLIFGAYIKIWNDLEFRRLNTVYQRQLELYIQNQKVDEKRNEEERKEKHDLKQNLYYILEMAKAGDVEKLVLFAEKLEKRVNSKHRVAKTGNDTLDTLINYQLSAAAAKGIAFETDLNIPSDLPYYEPDLCVLLGNLLDNAREAVERDKSQKGYIFVAMSYDRGNLVIKIKNSFDGIISKGKSGKLLTRKKDDWEHGLGLESVKMVTKKYNGKIQIDICHNEFNVEIIMYNH